MLFAAFYVPPLVNNAAQHKKEVKRRREKTIEMGSIEIYLSYGNIVAIFGAFSFSI